MKLIIASNNIHKISEISAMLNPLGYEVISQKEAGITLEPEETGTTFEENARIKARTIYDLCNGYAVLADDSGLAVDALDGAPGVLSHRYAGENATDADRIEKLLSEMRDIPKDNRSAGFICAMCFIDSGGNEILVKGECRGYIGFKPEGANGFGYDPIFYMLDGRSFAVLTSEEKNSVSHRKNALEKLCEKLSER